MKSRITLVVAALAALAVVPAVAQNPQGPPGGGRGQFGQRRMEMLMNGITLTAAQQAQVDSIQAAYRAKMPAFTPGQMPDSATRAQRFELMNQQDQDIRKVLTKEQQVVFDKNLADMRAMMMQRRPPGN
jgi:Spy/CpxP family protein refolding chaperone